MSHEGLKSYRLDRDINRDEHIYAMAWDMENCRKEPLLGYILGEGSKPAVFSKRDKQVADTIIQWLGTNVGQSFIKDCQVSIEEARQKDLEAGE